MSDDERISKIYKCLVGDKLSGQHGLIDTVNDIQDRQMKIENRLSNLEKRRTVKGVLKSLILIFVK